jgi:type I site-specific restriction endonuclease
MANQNAEQRARDRTDAQLREAGWTVQNAVAMNLNAADGIAMREYKMERGFGSAPKNSVQAVGER